MQWVNGKYSLSKCKNKNWYLYTSVRVPLLPQHISPCCLVCNLQKVFSPNRSTFFLLDRREIRISFASGESCRNAWNNRWFLSLRHCLDSIEQSGISKEHVLNFFFARLAFQKLPWIKVSLEFPWGCFQLPTNHLIAFPSPIRYVRQQPGKKNTEKIRDNPQLWTQNQSTVLEVWHRHHDHLLRTSGTTSGAAKLAVQGMGTVDGSEIQLTSWCSR